ncbi:hypothetical protein [Methanosarcina sp.]|uniref:hypothetical protein n=1 Tax=Methanosarcina sp. TaxID=2213 RepID=UPI002AB88906|nr:hypothetical protein [Methanosarcina sp.]MDY9925204.1 hypothetical protein [Methanosarcina sp.]
MEVKEEVSAKTGFAVVSNNTTSVIDATTNTVTATVPVGLANLGATFGKVKKLVGKNRNKKSDRFNFKAGF